ncbi:MAG: hypothetical protein EBU90_26995 [Proteobacteria bacterium]|nr:hypothetical protein [Pseudomonadota bacterium]
MKHTIETAIEELRELITIQKQPGTYDYNEYMYGMLIGLECAYFCILNQEANYTSRPKKFIDKINHVHNKGNKRTS